MRLRRRVDAGLMYPVERDRLRAVRHRLRHDGGRGFLGLAESDASGARDSATGGQCPAGQQVAPADAAHQPALGDMPGISGW
ncbi:hypothetical protein GCM10022251_32970 [Phytohabitans flavus]